MYGTAFTLTYLLHNRQLVLSIKQASKQSFNQSIQQPINQSINQSVNQSPNQPINQSIVWFAQAELGVLVRQGCV